MMIIIIKSHHWIGMEGMTDVLVTLGALPQIERRNGYGVERNESL
jgi:hypothetical protein|tara:strand:+ start:236 stop:370 length:135 start_codon:yes stop_codon:yes gene_type:complete